MAVVDLQQFKKEEEKKRRKLRRLYWRFLRTTKSFVAQRTYHCDYCIDSIASGDEYVREIFVNDKHFYEKFKHFPDCFAPSEEEDRKIVEGLEEERKKEEALSECA